MELGGKIDSRFTVYRGATLWDSPMVDDAKEIRSKVLLMSGAFGNSDALLDLPTELRDIDYNDVITDGELITALGDHLVVRFVDLQKRFQSGEFKTYEDWTKGIEKFLGLCRALRKISTSEYLETTGALDWTMRD
ncbi:MAG: hypothetical protein ACI87A_003645 [Planctomycetota bacterium]